VGGGVKAVERRRFEIPKKSWHGFCLVGIRQRSGGKAGRRKKGFALEVKKIPVEEDGISNRQDSTTFVPPLTGGGGRHFCLPQRAGASLPGGGKRRRWTSHRKFKELFVYSGPIRAAGMPPSTSGKDA
jgi:hypothetical protein